MSDYERLLAVLDELDIPYSAYDKNGQRYIEGLPKTLETVVIFDSSGKVISGRPEVYPPKKRSR